jgi:hypothetical protein
MMFSTAPLVGSHRECSGSISMLQMFGCDEFERYGKALNDRMSRIE